MNAVTKRKILQKTHVLIPSYSIYVSCRSNFSSKATPKLSRELQASYKLLNLPPHSIQDEVKKAFVELAKKYHPDSGSPEANNDKFMAVENAFTIITKYNTGPGAGASVGKEVEKKEYDIKHTAPQHRQYLSYEGMGHGTIFQRMKQHSHARAQKAAENVLEHRIAKSVASESTLMKKGSNFFRKNTVKEKYGMERLVEDLILESMGKGEFENLSGKGKPLKNQNNNPYVDFTTHKLNEVLINNGFTPSWILMNKEIEADIIDLRKQIEEDRLKLGPIPLTSEEEIKWNKISEAYRELTSSLNKKINNFNLIVPSMLKQKFHVDIEKILIDVLKNGECNLNRNINESKVSNHNSEITSSTSDDLLGSVFKLFWK